MNLFRTGALQILVPPPTLEGGLDVPECQVVIRFDKFVTAKSHIQGAGRARHTEAKVYYFESDPNFAQRAATHMIDTARKPEPAQCRSSKPSEIKG